MSPPRLALLVVESVLPARLAGPVAGDLVEAWHERPSPTRFWFEVLVVLLLQFRPRDARVALAGAAGALAPLVVVSFFFRALWAEVLVLVPLRAAHAPPLAWRCTAAALAAVLAVTGALACARTAARIFGRSSC